MNSTQARSKIHVPGMGTKTLQEMKAGDLTKNPNSKRVTIYRWNSSMENTQSKDQEVANYMATGTRSIGSYWEGKGSRRKGSGLTDEEIKLLLPVLVTVPSNDREFWQKVELFYTEYNRKVPIGNGLTLEIGLTKNNNEAISEENMPINVEQYVVFRHAIQHPQVALSREEAIGNKNKYFWVFDPQSIAMNEKENLELTEKATKYYQQLRNDPPRRQMMLTLLGFDITKYQQEHDPTTAEAKALKNMVDTDPVRFIAQFEQRNFEEMFWILLGIQHRVLRRAGDYILTKDGERIAASEEEACQWWKDPLNSEMVTMLKGTIQSASKFIGQKKKEAPKDTE